MLRGLRKASSNWVGKTIMAAVVAFLIGSFAIWGIGDIFRGYGMATAAKVGRTEITTEQFRQIYNDRLQQFGRQLGKPLTMEQARALGFDRQVLAQLTADLALDQRAQALRLNLSDAEIARQITSQPAFQTPSGQFDVARFQQAIRDAGFTEQRSAQYVLFDHAQAGDVGAPNPDALAKYFEERKILFRAPEYRKLELLTLIPAEQADQIEVSDDDIKRAYEEHRDSYGTPERRQIQQMIYPTLDAARADAERIANGASFADIAKERGIADKDIELGTLAKRAIIDRALADAAFALKEGETSAPVQGRFGVALIHVVKIEPEQIRPLAEVAPEIKKSIGTERAKSQILSVYDKIEDVRSEGHTLAEAAETLKLKARTVELDRSGHDPAGQAVADLPDPGRLLAAAFTSEIGVDADPLQVEGGYVWFEVAGVTPSRERSLEEVKDKVEANWREDEIAKRLKAKANAFMDKLKGGSAFSDTASAEGLKVETVSGLKRSAASPPFSANAVDRLFVTPKDAVASAAGEEGGDQIVFRVTDIVVPQMDANSDQTKTMAETLNRSLSQDLFGQYVTKVESEIGVTINRNAVNQVVSGGNSSSGNNPFNDDSDANF